LKFLFHNYHNMFNENNALFENRHSPLGDDLLRPFQILRERAMSMGISIGTESVIPLAEADAIVFVDLPDTNLPKALPLMYSDKPKYLIILESLTIRQLGDKELLRPFRKILTYDDSMIDNDRILKINYSFDLPREISIDSRSKEKFCVMIASNKKSSHPLELYSERVKAIRWFEKNHPEDFDLYGRGWDLYHFGTRFPLRRLNRYQVLKRAFARKFPSCRGGIERKKPVLERYKFAICYENLKDVPGYITEKIFDCFFSGCIPVYLGANNISDHIPDNCYIDRRKFVDYSSLYDFLVSLSDAELETYHHNIRAFLASHRAEAFSIDRFCSVIAKEIFNSR